MHTSADSLSEPFYRELRTYVEASDGLLCGDTLHVCDLLVQQFRVSVAGDSSGLVSWIPKVRNLLAKVFPLGTKQARGSWCQCSLDEERGPCRVRQDCWTPASANGP